MEWDDRVVATAWRYVEEKADAEKDAAKGR